VYGHWSRAARKRAAKLQRETLDIRIGLGIDRLEVFDQSFARCQMWRDLSEPDRRLHGFNLAEERGDGLELVMAPMDEQSLRRRRDTPVRRIRDCPTGFDLATHFVDEAVDVGAEWNVSGLRLTCITSAYRVSAQ
jgi:hypothetical protein